MPLVAIQRDYSAVVSEGGTYLYNGDCRYVLSVMLKSEVRYRLIFADPPFGIGVQYSGWYDDQLSEKEYQLFTDQWIQSAAKLLLPGGRLYVHVPDTCVFPVLLAAKTSGLIQDEWIIWHYRFGQCQKNRFINSKSHGLVFTNSTKDRIWNGENVLVPSDRATKYRDKRTLSTETPGRRVPFDVWGASVSGIDSEELPGDGPYWGRVSGSHSNAERRPLHSNQLPELYLHRIISAYTQPNDWVLDPFGGSGTTAVVAKALGRNVVLVEQSSEYAQSIVNRLEKGAVRV